MAKELMMNVEYGNQWNNQCLIMNKSQWQVHKINIHEGYFIQQLL